MKNLTIEQRYTISKLKDRNYTNKYIADTIGVNKSTISREWKRNLDKHSGKYNSDLADRHAKTRDKEYFIPDYKEDIKHLFYREEVYSRTDIRFIQPIFNDFCISLNYL